MENSKNNSLVTFFKSTYLTIVKDNIGEAVRKGDVKTVKAFMECDADVNEINSHGIAPIHNAIIWGHLNCLVLLLEHKNININIKPTKGEFQKTALHLAVSGGDISAIKLLLLNRADYNSIHNQYNQTALEAIPNNQVIRNTVYETLDTLAQINQAVDKAKVSLEQEDYENCVKYYRQAGVLILEKFANSESNEDAKKHYLKKALDHFEKLIEPYQKLDKEKQANYKDLLRTIDQLKEQIGQPKKYEYLYQTEASMSKPSHFFQTKNHEKPQTIRKRKNGYIFLEEEKSQISQKIA